MPASETIKIYAFIEADGREQEFVTLDENLALQRAAKYGLKIVERTYEYKSSRRLGVLTHKELGEE